jgi:hypothetical protein
MTFKLDFPVLSVIHHQFIINNTVGLEVKLVKIGWVEGKKNSEWEKRLMRSFFF